MLSSRAELQLCDLCAEPRAPSGLPWATGSHISKGKWEPTTHPGESCGFPKSNPLLPVSLLRGSSRAREHHLHTGMGCWAAPEDFLSLLWERWCRVLSYTPRWEMEPQEGM